MKRKNKYHVRDVSVFAADLVKLARKYPSVVRLVENLFNELEIGNIHGVSIPRVNIQDGKIFKTRLANPDARKGKSGGFRVIWLLNTSNNNIYPLTIYSKSDQEDIHPQNISNLINKHLKL